MLRFFWLIRLCRSISKNSGWIISWMQTFLPSSTVTLQERDREAFLTPPRAGILETHTHKGPPLLPNLFQKSHVTRKGIFLCVFLLDKRRAEIHLPNRQRNSWWTSRLSSDAEILLTSTDWAYKRVKNRICNVYVFRLSFHLAYRRCWLGRLYVLGM